MPDTPSPTPTPIPSSLSVAYPPGGKPLVSPAAGLQGLSRVANLDTDERFLGLEPKQREAVFDDIASRDSDLSAESPRNQAAIRSYMVSLPSRAAPSPAPTPRPEPTPSAPQPSREPAATAPTEWPLLEAEKRRFMEAGESSGRLYPGVKALFDAAPDVITGGAERLGNIFQGGDPGREIMEGLSGETANKVGSGAWDVFRAAMSPFQAVSGAVIGAPTEGFARHLGASPEHAKSLADALQVAIPMALGLSGYQPTSGLGKILSAGLGIPGKEPAPGPKAPAPPEPPPQAYPSSKIPGAFKPRQIPIFHISRMEGLDEVDPAFQGSVGGRMGAERKALYGFGGDNTKLLPGRANYTNWYTAEPQTKVENFRFQNGIVYEPIDKPWLTNRPGGLIEAQYARGRNEAELVAQGYTGLYYPEEGQVQLFHSTPVRETGKVRPLQARPGLRMGGGNTPETTVEGGDKYLRDWVGPHLPADLPEKPEEIVQYAKDHFGGTFDPRDGYKPIPSKPGLMHDGRYVVGGVGREVLVPEGKLTSADISQFAEENNQALAPHHRFLGLWNNGKGSYSLDVSDLWSSEEEAQAVARERPSALGARQETIWDRDGIDPKTGEPGVGIPVRAKGEPPATVTFARMQDGKVIVGEPNQSLEEILANNWTPGAQVEGTATIRLGEQIPRPEQFRPVSAGEQQYPPASVEIPRAGSAGGSVGPLPPGWAEQGAAARAEKEARAAEVAASGPPSPPPGMVQMYHVTTQEGYEKAQKDGFEAGEYLTDLDGVPHVAQDMVEAGHVPKGQKLVAVPVLAPEASVRTLPASDDYPVTFKTLNHLGPETIGGYVPPPRVPTPVPLAPPVKKPFPYNQDEPGPYRPVGSEAQKGPFLAGRSGQDQIPALTPTPPPDSRIPVPPPPGKFPEPPPPNQRENEAARVKDVMDRMDATSAVAEQGEHGGPRLPPPGEFPAIPEGQQPGGDRGGRLPPLNTPREPPPLPPELRGNVLSEPNAQKVATAALDVMVKAGIPRDPKIRVTQQVMDLIANDKIPLPMFEQTLADHGMNFMDFAVQFGYSKSDAGRQLAQMSVMQRSLSRLAVDNPEAARALQMLHEAMGSSHQAQTREWWQRVTDIWRKALITRVSTATRNATQQGATLIVDAFDTGLNSAFQNTGALLAGQKIEDKVGMFDGLEQIWNVMRYTRTKQEANGILSAFPAERDRLFQNYMSELGKAEGGASGLLQRTLDATDKGFDYANTLNTFQEYAFRRGVFTARLAARLRAKGQDLAALEAEGPSGLAKIAPEDISAAVDKALQLTYAVPPEGKAARAIAGITRDVPFAALIMPFPRWMINSTRWAFDHSPLAITKLLSASERAALASGDYESMAKMVTGSALLGGAIGLRQSDYAGENWYEIKIGDKIYDARPYYPFSAYLYLADLYVRHKKGTLYTIKPEDVAANIASANVRGGTGLELLDDAIKMAQVTKQGGGVAGKAKLGAESVAGQIAAGFSTPLQNFYDVAASMDEELAKSRDVRERPLAGPTLARVPIRSVVQTMPEREAPTREENPRMRDPLLKMATGFLQLEPKSDIQKEFDRLQIDRRTYAAGTGYPEIDNAVHKILGPQIEKAGREFMGTPWYQSQTDDWKRLVLQDWAGAQREMAVAKTLHDSKDTHPDWFRKLRIESMPQSKQITIGKALEKALEDKQKAAAAAK